VWILAGELDVSSADMVVRDGLDAIQQTSTGVLVADLSGVTFLDSYAIEAFDTVRVAARMHSRALKIVGVHPRIYRVFSLVGLARTFGLSDPTGSAR
jgi:anti-anti-sigma factor